MQQTLLYNAAYFECWMKWDTDEKTDHALVSFEILGHFASIRNIKWKEMSHAKVDVYFVFFFTTLYVLVI